MLEQVNSIKKVIFGSLIGGGLIVAVANWLANMGYENAISENYKPPFENPWRDIAEPVLAETEVTPNVPKTFHLKANQSYGR